MGAKRDTESPTSQRELLLVYSEQLLLLQVEAEPACAEVLFYFIEP